MIAIAVIGILILAGAAALGVDGVLGNRGASHQIAGGFHAYGHTFHGSSGQLFFWGLVVGAAAFLGLVLLVAGLRGRSRRRSGRAAVRHEPQHAVPVTESAEESAASDTGERPDDQVSSRAPESSSIPAQASESADS